MVAACKLQRRNRSLLRIESEQLVRWLKLWISFEEYSSTSQESNVDKRNYVELLPRHFRRPRRLLLRSCPQNTLLNKFITDRSMSFIVYHYHKKHCRLPSGDKTELISRLTDVVSLKLKKRKEFISWYWLINLPVALRRKLNQCETGSLMSLEEQIQNRKSSWHTFSRSVCRGSNALCWE